MMDGEELDMTPTGFRPCIQCGRFQRISEPTCPHCGSVHPFRLSRTTKGALLGLAIGSSVSCVAESKYGMADSGYFDNPTPSDTADTGDTGAVDGPAAVNKRD